VAASSPDRIRVRRIVSVLGIALSERSSGQHRVWYLVYCMQGR
jgi:hypothetical protein